jgi:hypothetical protein
MLAVKHRCVICLQQIKISQWIEENRSAYSRSLGSLLRSNYCQRANTGKAGYERMLLDHPLSPRDHSSSARQGYHIETVNSCGPPTQEDDDNKSDLFLLFCSWFGY